MLLAVLLVSAAVPPATQALRWECEIYCWDYGDYGCFQNSACQYYCCYYNDPTCRPLC
jgi:hypothetical protein